MNNQGSADRQYVRAITASGLSIYDSIEVGDPTLWIPAPNLESILNASLRGTSLAGLPLRTRSKVAKGMVCEALGYPIPRSFRKTQPRFPGQNLDTYVQKSKNLQIWNEELSPTRRYVLIRLNSVDEIECLRVVTGDTLAVLDTTGTLTQKYQARCDVDDSRAELISTNDTDRIAPFTNSAVDLSLGIHPTDQPQSGQLLPIVEVFNRLQSVIGECFSDSGIDQERNRGAALHQLICASLGFATYQDDGRFPDIRQQLLEVKLQTAPTIDLGLVSPDSEAPLDVTQIEGVSIRHCDVRYVVAVASTDGRIVEVTHVIVTTGADFFTKFPQFGGRVLNKKIQIPLPSGFFDLEAE